MTDNQIIKALEICSLSNTVLECENCPYDDYGQQGCASKLNKDALDLINRQQAEIERLNKAIDNYEACLESIEKIKAKAFKEFVDEIQKEISILQKEYFERKKEREFELEQASYSLIIDRTLQYYRGKIEVLDAINLLINTKLKEMAGDKL